MVGWFAIVAPAGTPAAAIQRFNRDLDAVLSDKEVAERIAASARSPSRHGRPDRRLPERRAPRWAAITNEIGVLPE